MRTHTRLDSVLLAVIIAPCLFAAAHGEERSPQRLARQILETTGVRAGLIVHVGCGDGRLTVALCQGDSYRVHGLDADAANIQKARDLIRSRGLYGPVSVERWEGTVLPHADNLANLVVVEERGAIPASEVMRVLAPYGVAYVKRGNGWHKEVKPCSDEVDEWTHFLHDASNNAVAHDRVVGPPRHMQWVAAPRYTRSHEHIPGINALVSAQGRIFYIEDGGPISSVRQPPQWHLVARDAYNGILLWRRPIEAWFPHVVNWGQTPSHLQRRLIALKDRVFVTLGLHAPLSAVDAATGDVLKVYEGTDGTEEVLYHQGVLLLAVREVTDERREELVRWAKLTRDKHSPLYARESAQPLVNELRSTERKGATTILALDAQSGRVLWRKTGPDTSGLRALSLCASGNRVFYQRGKTVICADLESGHEQWSANAVALRLVHGDSVFCVGNGTVAVLSAENGQIRWTQTALLTDIRDVFVVNGFLWLGGFKPFPQKRGPSWGPYYATQRDLATGAVVKHVTRENPGHHHRCYQNKATDRYILVGRRGTEFVDLDSGEIRENSWARGVCKYGVMPCNGLMYAPPHACACYVGTKTTGFTALASTLSSSAGPGAAPPWESRYRGTAYDEVQEAGDKEDTGADWPTYRGDPARSGFTPAIVPPVLSKKWLRHLGGHLSSPVVASGKVFVASVETHTVYALEAATGELLWNFVAGGRVDSSPTVLGDRVLFGSRDGSVYCLRAFDGALAWRFQGDGPSRRIMAHGQLESASPAHGSVLVQNGEVYFTLGRSSYLDGGITLYRLDHATGKVLSQTPIYSPDPETGEQPPQYAPSAMPGVRTDILTGDGHNVFLRDQVFDSKGATGTEDTPRLITLTDFLDDTWAHRSYWIFGNRISISTGCSGQARGLIYGRLLVFNDSTVYGYGRTKVHWSNQLQDGAYRLFATNRNADGRKWEKSLKIWARAMVLAGETLFIAGLPFAADGDPVFRDTSQGGRLLAVSASDGTTLAECNLEAPPVFDGMAAVPDRLYVTLANGSLVCMWGAPGK